MQVLTAPRTPKPCQNSTPRRSRSILTSQTTKRQTLLTAPAISEGIGTPKALATRRRAQRRRGARRGSSSRGDQRSVPHNGRTRRKNFGR